MKGSYIAFEIDKEYKREQIFKKRARQQCVVDKEKQCDRCNYNEVCEEN